MRKRSLSILGGLLLLAAAGVQAHAAGFATYFAVVAATGHTTHGSGVAASAHTARGTYLISFNRKVNTCSAVASVLGRSAAYATVQTVAGKPGKLTIRTFASNGAIANQAFNLVVLCGP